MHRYVVAIAIAAASLAACSKSLPPDAPQMVVYKTSTCQCCSRWLAHLHDHGIATRVELTSDLAPIRSKLGVPESLASCHTGVLGAYLVEGHVPAEDIQRMLKAKPSAKGIAVPGMPVGSPGMEMGDRHDPYDVLLFDGTGKTQIFAHHGPAPAASTSDTGS